MSAPAVPLDGFAYGEHLEGSARRSLGFRLLTPAAPETWTTEVEALARRLQAAPYPDHWPPTDLFCSVLLGDGRRLVALARYGLADHTPSRRRGGLELIGVIGPGSLGVPSALAIYHWLQRRRAETADLHDLGGRHWLNDLLAQAPPAPLPSDPVPILPIRLWQDGALLFAASVPSDPDHHLRLLEQGASDHWQWLPLIGPDFPLPAYAQRGPLIAWTPHLAGVALKVDRAPEQSSAALGRGRALRTGLVILLLLLGIGNLWATWSVSRHIPSPAPAAISEPAPAERAPPVATPTDAAAERFARALHRLIEAQGGLADGDVSELARRYERLAAQDPDLRLAGSEGQKVVVAANTLTRRTTGQIETAVRKALRGYDPRLIDLACQQVREQLNAPHSVERP